MSDQKQSGLADLLQKHFQEASLNDTGEQIRAAIADLSSTHFENANRYQRAVMAGGYAAFFATWGFTKDTMDSRIMIVSALFMIFSVGVFILHQVFTMQTLSKMQVAQLKIIHDTPANRVMTEVETLKAREKAFVLLQQKATIIAFSTAMVSALVALILMVGSFVIFLIKEFHSAG